MATFGEIHVAAHSVNRIISLYYMYMYVYVKYFGFEDRALVLIAPVPSHCLPFYSTWF